MTNVVDAASSAATASSAPTADAAAIPAPAGAVTAPVGTVTAPTISSIDEGRHLIDDIDAQIRALVTTRKEVSRQVQALRAEEGGPRVQHGRENAIISTWADELGPRGAEIALAILTLCRGNLP